MRFAADERAETTMGMLAECFEALGGVPGKVLADRMGCLKGGIVANVVVPTGQYVRFAAHYGFSELDHFLYVCHVMQHRARLLPGRERVMRRARRGCSRR